MSRRANPTLVGVFVLGGVLLAVLSTVVFGSGKLFRDTQGVISFFDGSVSGLQIGSAVKFRGITVGEVTEVLFDVPGLRRPGGDVRVAVVYELDRELAESRGAGVRLPDPLDIDTLLSLGIRAELSTESIVTGRKFIALDLDPANPVTLEEIEGIPYPEIPTINTGLERIEDELYGIIAEVASVQLNTLVDAATAAFTEIGSLATSPDLSGAIDDLPTTVANLNAVIVDLRHMLAGMDSSIGPMRDGVLTTTTNADMTLQQVQATMEQVEAVFAPQSPILFQFERALMELGAAGRSLRELTDYLERNPSAILRGKPGPGQR